MLAPENQWSSHNFHPAIDHAARDILNGIETTEEQFAAARRRVLLHWLIQAAPAGCA